MLFRSVEAFLTVSWALLKRSIFSMEITCFFSSTGITDHTNILPASLISPMGTDNTNCDYNNMFDRADVDADSLLDVWADVE